MVTPPMSSLMPALAAIDSQHGLITSAQARSCGLTHDEIGRLLRTGAWRRLRRGVFVDAEAWAALDPYREQPLLRVRAAQLTLWSSGIFSHDSAALAHDIGLPDPLRALVHVTRRKVHGDRVRAGVKHHLAPFRREDVVTVAGLQVLDLGRTAADLAREHGLMAGVAACDAVLRRGVTRSQLHAVLQEMHCWPGSTVIRASIEMSDAGAESYLESQARVVVNGLGLGRPQTQFGLTDGHRIVWCDLRIGRHIFEVDGRQKYAEGNVTGKSPDRVLWEEKERQDFITGFGLGVSRITRADCHERRRQAQQRLLREYAATRARLGTNIDDLAPYVVRRR